MSTRPTGWLADPALTRIWQVLRERLEGRGLRAEGRVVLSGLSREERHAVSALVGRPVTRATLVLSLADVDATLAERSGIGGLQAVLEHVTGHALDDRAARRAQRAAGREAPFTLARELVGDAPWVEAWLDGVRRSGVLARTADPAAAVRRAVETLARLPTSIARTELAVAVGGGAHALDDGSTVAALVLRALAARLGEPPPVTTAERRGLWERFGVRVDLGVHDLPHPRPPRPGRLLGRGPDGARRGRGRPRAPHRLGSAAGRAADAGRRAGVREPARAGGRGGTARRSASLRCARAGSRRSSCWTSCTPWPARGCATTATSTGPASRSRTGSSRRSGWFRGGWGPTQYLAALHGPRVPLLGTPIEPVWDRELGAAMRHHGVAVHEEAVLDDLLAAVTTG